MKHFLKISWLAAGVSALLSAACSEVQAVHTPRTSTGVKLEGLSVELDPHFISQNTTRGDGCTVEVWDNVIVPRVKMMDIQRMRVMLLPHWWEPVNDNNDPNSMNPDGFDFDNIEMKSLYAVLDLAQETNASVTLVLWGCPAHCSFIDENTPGQGQRHFLCDKEGKNWVTPPADNEEFAENFAAVVKHLIFDKGYTCVKEVTPFNEPDGDVCGAEQYALIVRAMDARFREEGLRDKVRFNLSDNTDTRRFYLKECVENVGEFADIFNSHTYMCGYESTNSYAQEWESENVNVVRSTGKKHLVGEFGSNLCVGATRQKDINWYERGVLITRNCLNFLNAGAAGASYWSLIDQYYNRDASYEAMQQLGLWRHLKSTYRQEDADGCESDWQPRPQYYAYSMLTRFIRRGDEVYPLNLENEFATGSAFRSEDGKWTYVFANGSSTDMEFDLTNANAAKLGACDVYVYSKESLPKDDSMIQATGKVKASNGKYRINLPAQTTLLLNEI